MEQKGLSPLVIIGLLIVSVFLFINKNTIFGSNDAPHSFTSTTVAPFDLWDSEGKVVAFNDVIQSFESPMVLVSLWATWCTPCVKEIPLMQSRREVFKEMGIDLMLLNYDNGVSEPLGREKIFKWFEKVNVNLPNFFDPKEILLEGLTVHALPFNVLFSKEGTALYLKAGFFNEEEIFDVSKKYLENKL